MLSVRRRPATPAPTPYSFGTDPSRFDFDVIHPLLARSYWSPRIRREAAERAFASSVVCVTISVHRIVVHPAETDPHRELFALAAGRPPAPS